MSFRKNKKQDQSHIRSHKVKKIEKIEEILDENEKSPDVKDLEIKNLMVINLKNLNGKLLLKINDYEKNHKKLEKDKRKRIRKMEKLEENIVNFDKKKTEDIQKINLENENNIDNLKKEHKQYIYNLNEKKRNEREEIYQKHEKKIIKINDQHEKYKERYRNEIKTINLQNKEYNDIMRKEEKEIYEKKIMQKEHVLQGIYDKKTKVEIDKLIKQREIRQMDIEFSMKVTEKIGKDMMEQMISFKEKIINGKFHDDKFQVVCLCDNEKDDTNKILIENELNIFSEVEYVPYFKFHSEYVSRIITVLKCLEIFLENEKKFLILFEYDFQWLFNKDIILEKLNSIKNYENINLLLLNYNNYFLTYKFNNYKKNLIGIQCNAHNINSFIINKTYAKKLIKILEITIKDIVQNNNPNKKLYEKCFNKLLKDHKCHGIVPSLGKQRLIFNQEQNINCIIAIIENNTEILYDTIPYFYKIIKKATYNFCHGDFVYLNEKDDISSEIIKYCYKEFPKLDYLFVFKNGYNYTKKQIHLIFKTIVENESNLILDKNSENFFIKLKKENLDLTNLINNKDFKIIDFKL